MPRRKKPKVGRPKGTREPLDERHFTAIRMMTQPGRWTHEEIAQEVGVSRTMLWKWRQRKDFQREYNKELRRVLRKVGRENATTTYAKEALKGDAKAARTLLEAADMI